MSEQLYLFKFNEEIARTKLSALINKDDSFSYKQYLFESNRKYEESLQFDNIKNKIDKNIELLSIDELWSLYDWFSQRTENRTNEEMRNYGLDLFYDFPTTTQVRNFHAMLEDYEYLTDQDIGYICGSDELDGFLNYVISYSGELTIFLNRYFYEMDERCDENLQIEQLIYDVNSTSNSYFHNLALAEFEKSMEYYKETMQLVPELREFRRANKDKSSYSTPAELYEIEKRVSKIISVTDLLYLASCVKEDIKNYDGKIARLHAV